MIQEVYAGIDVSKATLDADWGERRSCENNTRGIEKLIREFRKAGVVFVVVEATGGYENMPW